jgi:hypothetical protein
MEFRVDLEDASVKKKRKGNECVFVHRILRVTKMSNKEQKNKSYE